MSKIDFKKELKELYGSRKGKYVSVNVPKMKYLMIDGEGNPNTSESFSKSIESLYALSYGIKFISKKEYDNDYVVMPLEGLWYSDDMSVFIKGEKESWKWTLMIMQPDFINEEIFNKALENVKKKKNIELIDKVEFKEYEEGNCAQILYVGPYSEEHDTIMNLHEFIKNNGHELSGHHHEIYLSDARKTAPEKLKTIIRQPYK